MAANSSLLGLSAAAAIASSEEVAYRSFDNSDSSLGLFPGKVDGKDVVTTDVLDLSADISRDNFTIINPQVQPGASTMLNTSSQIQYKIPKGSCGKIDEVWLDLNMNEYGAANPVTPAMMPGMFQRIDIGLDSTAPIQQLWPDHLYTRFQQESSEQVQIEFAGNAMNMGFPSFSGPSAIPASGQATYSSRFPMFMARGEIDMRAANSDIIMTFFFNNNPVSAGTGLLGYVSSQLRIRWRADPYYDPKRLIVLKRRPFVLSYVDALPLTYTQTLTAGQQTVIPLTGISGYCASLLMNVKLAATSTTQAGNGLFNYLALEGPGLPIGTGAGYLDLQSAGSVSLFNAPNILTPTYFRTQAMLLPRSNGVFGLSVASYRMDFASVFGTGGAAVTEDSGASRLVRSGVIDNGTCSGGYLFTGNEKLIISPGVGFAASGSSCTITVVPYMYRTILVIDGVFKALGSGASIGALIPDTKIFSADELRMLARAGVSF